jgi:hypothetical protein
MFFCETARFVRTAFVSNRNSSFVIRHFNWVSGGIKSPHPAAVLAIPAAMRIAGSAPFPLLQRKPARSVAASAFPSALAVRAFSIGFSHFTPLSQQKILVLATRTVK